MESGSRGVMLLIRGIIRFGSALIDQCQGSALRLALLRAGNSLKLLLMMVMEEQTITRCKPEMAECSIGIYSKTVFKETKCNLKQDLARYFNNSHLSHTVKRKPGVHTVICSTHSN